MNFHDAKLLMAEIVAYDGRKNVDAMVVEVWATALADYTLDEARFALHQFIRHNTDEWLRPGHLVLIIRQKRDEYRMMNPGRRYEADAWLEFEQMQAMAAEQSRAIRSSGKRLAVEAMESGEYDDAE